MNILNDYVDFKSGVDLKTIKTPFSGGSGLLPAKIKCETGAVVRSDLFDSGSTCRCFLFVAVQGWQLLPLIVIAGLCIVLYTPFILKSHFPEWSPGLGLGILPVLGAYFVQTGHYTFSAFAASVPAGFLVLNFLLLNEFPDVEAGITVHRRTLPITVGKKWLPSFLQPLQF